MSIYTDYGCICPKCGKPYLFISRDTHTGEYDSHCSNCHYAYSIMLIRNKNGSIRCKEKVFAASSLMIGAKPVSKQDMGFIWSMPMDKWARKTREKLKDCNADLIDALFAFLNCQNCEEITSSVQELNTGCCFFVGIYDIDSKKQVLFSQDNIRKYDEREVIIASAQYRVSENV